MNPFVKLLLDRLIAYVSSHPEIIDQLVDAGAKALVAWLQTLNPPKA